MHREPLGEPQPAALRVWDRPVRLLHWTLVASLATATLGLWWLSGVHQPAGYVALAAVLLRLVWGWKGAAGSPASNYTRFAQFVRGPHVAWAYARDVWRHRERRYIGHNPLGGWMVLALMACVCGLALTGWLYTTDRFWGDETIERMHRSLAWLLLALVITHVAGVVLTSLRHRENLVLAMFSGRKRAAQGDDVA